MDEVDKIIIHSLNSIGCSLDDEVDSLSKFTAEHVYNGVRCCIEAIKQEEIDAPKSLPPGMSQKFKAGSTLANYVKEAGYKGDVGYQTFLYSNEADLRKILMYLVDKLPKDTSGSSDEPSNGASTQLLRQVISNKIKEQLRKVWLPHVCYLNDAVHQAFRGHVLLAPTKDSSKASPELKKYYSDYLLPLDSQCPNGASLCSALIENHTLQLIQDQNTQWRLHAPKPKNKAERIEEIRKQLLEEREHAVQAKLEKEFSSHELPQSRFTQLEKLQHTHQAEAEPKSNSETSASSETQSTEEVIREKQEQEVAALRKELMDITTRISKLNRNMEKAGTATEQIKKDIEEKQTTVETQKKAYQVKKKTLDVLPEAEQTIKKVKQLINGADDRMKALERQWLEHKGPLTQQLEDLRLLAASRQASTDQKLAEIQDFKQQMKSAAEEAKAKEELVKSLTSEYEGMSKDASRSSYTKRIIEIVGNIKKQRHDIDKVLDDTRRVQKDINMLSGKLDRTFTVTDELIFKDARRDESVKAAYKYLASLHDNFNAVRNTIEETGVILREIRQLEDQIDQERSKDSAANLQKITKDYKQIKRENQQLLEKLKA